MGGAIRPSPRTRGRGGAGSLVSCRVRQGGGWPERGRESQEPPHPPDSQGLHLGGSGTEEAGLETEAPERTSARKRDKQPDLPPSEPPDTRPGPTTEGPRNPAARRLNGRSPGVGLLPSRPGGARGVRPLGAALCPCPRGRPERSPLGLLGSLSAGPAAGCLLGEGVGAGVSGRGLLTVARAAVAGGGAGPAASRIPGYKHPAGGRAGDPRHVGGRARQAPPPGPAPTPTAQRPRPPAGGRGPVSPSLPARPLPLPPSRGPSPCRAPGTPRPPEGPRGVHAARVSSPCPAGRRLLGGWTARPWPGDCSRPARDLPPLRGGSGNKSPLDAVNFVSTLIPRWPFCRPRNPSLPPHSRREPEPRCRRHWKVGVSSLGPGLVLGCLPRGWHLTKLLGAPSK